MIATLPNPTDAHDWRDAIPGLVRLEPGHVYGKTKLSQQEWRQLAHKRHGQFVLLYDGPHVSRRVDSLPKRYEAAQADFAYGLELVGRSYHPHSGRRLSVMAATDWQRRLTSEAGPLVYVPPAPVVDEVAGHRAQVVESLRVLVAFLESTPAVPVSEYALKLTFSVNRNDGDEAAIARVRAAAAALGVEAENGSPGHWGASRMFGEVEYGVSYIERDRLARHRAADSYNGVVEPDGIRSAEESGS